MIGHNNKGFIYWDVISIFKRKSSTQYIQASHEKELKPIYRYFVSFEAEYVKTNPLQGMKYDKHDAEA